MIRESGSVDRAREEARAFGERAVAALGALPDGEPRRKMADLVEFVLSRDT